MSPPLGVDFGPTMFSNQLDKAGGAPSLFPKALAGLADLKRAKFPMSDVSEILGGRARQGRDQGFPTFNGESVSVLVHVDRQSLLLQSLQSRPRG